MVAVLDEIVAHGDPAIGVRIEPAKRRLQIGKDALGLSVTSDRSGYLYVYLAGTGAPALQLIFPNSTDRDNKIEPGVARAIPRRDGGVFFPVGGPPGEDLVVAVVSPEPREFERLGPRASDPIIDFDLAAIQRLWEMPMTDATPFVGTPRCTAHAGCEGRYGAAAVRFEEYERTK